MKILTHSKDFQPGALVGLSINYIALCWFGFWLFLGILGAGMSTAPTNQDFEDFIWVASCIPVTLNAILFALGIARRQLLFLAGCLFGLLITLLTAGCLVGDLALNVWLNMA